MILINCIGLQSNKFSKNSINMAFYNYIYFVVIVTVVTWLIHLILLEVLVLVCHLTWAVSTINKQKGMFVVFYQISWGNVPLKCFVTGQVRDSTPMQLQWICKNSYSLCKKISHTINTAYRDMT